MTGDFECLYLFPDEQSAGRAIKTLGDRYRVRGGGLNSEGRGWVVRVSGDVPEHALAAFDLDIAAEDAHQAVELALHEQWKTIEEHMEALGGELESRCWGIGW